MILWLCDYVLMWTATSDYTRHFEISDWFRQLLVPFDYQHTVVFPNLRHLKRVAGYLFGKERNVLVHIIISSIMRHIRLYQILSDITLNHVSYVYLYLLIIHSKLCHTKWVAEYLFGTVRNVIHTIMSNITSHVRLQQIFAEITLNLVSYLYLFIINTQE